MFSPLQIREEIYPSHYVGGPPYRAGEGPISSGSISRDEEIVMAGFATPLGEKIEVDELERVFSGGGVTQEQLDGSFVLSIRNLIVGETR